MTHYVAIDIGGTNIKYGLVDQEGQLVESHEMPTYNYVDYLVYLMLEYHCMYISASGTR